MRRMSNSGHFMLPGGGTMSKAEYQYVFGFRAGVLQYTLSFMHTGRCTVELQSFRFS